MATILIVDDNVDSCRNLADILSAYGYDVDIATSGTDALNLVRRRDYLIALLDLKMPEMDGITLSEEIHRECPAIIAMIVTAFLSEEAEERAKNAHIDQVIAKPVDVPRLLSCVREAASQRVKHSSPTSVS
ncbi:MAG: response regulator [Planctomycetaceae bacterium]|nr:response regulator [Planctomycetaceae bacterium]